MSTLDTSLNLLVLNWPVRTLEKSTLKGRHRQFLSLRMWMVKTRIRL